jgi:DNA-binding NtrC family response regulator
LTYISGTISQEFTVPLLAAEERSFAEALSRFSRCNPFVPERDEIMRELLGEAFVNRGDRAYAQRFDRELGTFGPNLTEIWRRTHELAPVLQGRLQAGIAATPRELALYEDLVLYHLYRPQLHEFDRAISSALRSGTVKPMHRWEPFREEFGHYLHDHGRTLPSDYDPAHIFALFYQLRRGFHHIQRNIYGSSAAVARLRASVWQSIVTHDLRRYSRTLYERMGDNTLLITGPSGSGKELVARAVGLSRYIPFDEKTKTFDDFTGSFHPVNLSAVPATLVESELFGHVKGAFTGAVRDRKGQLGLCDDHGTLFLDEIGELQPSLQVKLLRVLERGEYRRVGETELRNFPGKVIAATNRDLGAERRAGRFRDDLFYRLCSDMIVTPSLEEQLSESRAELRDIVTFVTRRVAGDDADELADDVTNWIEEHLSDYGWPGNFRELEQCVRNVMIRREYHPDRTPRDNAALDPLVQLGAAVTAGELTLEQLETNYASLVYAQTGNYKEAAERLGCDWRTLKSRIDEEVLDGFRRARAARGKSARVSGAGCTEEE